MESSLPVTVDPRDDSRSGVAGAPLNHSRLERLSDSDLVARAARGERGAFDTLHARHYARLYNLALRLEGTRDGAADVTQAAFVRAYTGLRRLHDGQAFEKWLIRIAVNLVRDRTKAARRRPWALFTDLLRVREDDDRGSEPADFADAAADPERIALAHGRDAALAQAIRALPLEFREVVVLHHLEQMNVRPIAEALCVPEGTVKSRLGRARRRLREALRHWLDTGEDSDASPG